MVTYEFSQLNTLTTNYYLNSNDFAGTEYMFQDNISQLYAVVCRRNGTKLDILQSMLLNGHNNGGDVATKYDYRIDLSNYIKIVHHDPKYFDYTVENSNVKRFDIPDNACEIFLIISTTNILNVNSSLIYTYGNGDLYFNYSDFSSIVADKLKENFIFNDIDGYTANFSTPFMNNGYAVFRLAYHATEVYSLTNVTFRDSSGTYVPGYGFGYTITNDTTKHRVILCKIPDNAVTVQHTINGSTAISPISGCVRNQYFYFGVNNKIDTLMCTGKREVVKSVERTMINNGRSRNTLKIDKQERYTQNTGMLMNESTIFDIAVTPFLIEFDFDNWGEYTKWYIDNTDFEGYNTKSISNRNFVLNLSKDKKDKRYTSVNVNFFD